jgi:hypothetical protein
MPTFLAGSPSPKVTAAPSGCPFCWFGFGAASANTAAEATKPVNDAPPKVRFASESPLEEGGFEPRLGCLEISVGRESAIGLTRLRFC